jgi:hypothetical protein
MSERYDLTSIGPVQADEIVQAPTEPDEFADAVKYLAPRIPPAERLPHIVTHAPRRAGKSAMAEANRKAYEDEIADPSLRITEHLPSTVAAGVLADLAHVQGKIPADLHVETPHEITARVDPPEQSRIVIGIGGPMEHGKDSLADILVRDHGFVKFGMSDAINDILMVLNPFVHTNPPTLYAEWVERYGYTEAKTNPEIRRLLRVLGTEVGRDMIDRDIWVKIMSNKISAALREGKNVAVTGIRNGDNEIAMINAFGGATVWVQRPGHPVPDTTHASENSLTREDFEIGVLNNGTLENLAGCANALVRQVNARKRAEQSLRAEKNDAFYTWLRARGR